MLNSYETLTSFSKSLQDAATVSSKEFSKGVEELATVYIGYAGKSIDEATKVTKALAACKTPEEVIALQQKLAKDGIASFQAESKKLAEKYCSLVKSTVEPFAAQYKAAVDGALKPAA